MKKTILLAAMLPALVFSGCSDDEAAPYITIAEEALEVENEGAEYTIEVEANCDWYVNIDADWVHVNEVSTGSGNGSFSISVGKNDSFEDRTAKVFVDGSACSDTLLIHQKINYGLFPHLTSNVSVEGWGKDFIVSIRSNIENLQIEFPDWITHIETKSLSTIDYSFRAAPNDTKEKRVGTITFSGQGQSMKIYVSQDVINPDKVYALPFPSYVSELGRVEIPLTLYPETAGMANVRFISSDTNVCRVSVEGETLVLDYVGVGEAYIQCSVLDEELWNIKTTCYTAESINLWIDDGGWGILIGEQVPIGANMPLSQFTFETTTPDLVSINGNTIYALNEGVATIIATEINTNAKFTLEANIKSAVLYHEYRIISPDHYSGVLRVRSNKSIHVRSMRLIDAVGNMVLSVYGDALQSNNTSNVYWEYDYLPGTNVDWEQIGNYTFSVAYTLQGELYERTSTIPYRAK